MSREYIVMFFLKYEFLFTCFLLTYNVSCKAAEHITITIWQCVSDNQSSHVKWNEIAIDEIQALIGIENVALE